MSARRESIKFIIVAKLQEVQHYTLHRMIFHVFIFGKMELLQRSYTTAFFIRRFFINLFIQSCNYIMLTHMQILFCTHSYKCSSCTPVLFFVVHRIYFFKIWKTCFFKILINRGAQTLMDNVEYF